MLNPVQFLWLLRKAALDWQRDEAALFGAAIAFYTFFSLAPMLLVVIAVAGLVYGDDAARGRIVGEVTAYVGRGGAEALQNVLVQARPSTGSLTASVLGLATMFFGATRAFGSLKSALDRMWNVGSSSGRSVIAQLALNRLLSFFMLLCVGAILLALLGAGALLAAIDAYAPGWIPEGAAAHLLRALELAVSLGAAFVLFALVYRVLPEAEVEWKDVWLGALIAAILFTAGKSAMAWYLGRGSLASLFGAAGSLVALLLWIYYSAQILLFGAEVTEVFSEHWGSHSQQPSRRG